MNKISKEDKIKIVAGISGSRIFMIGSLVSSITNLAISAIAGGLNIASATKKKDKIDDKSFSRNILNEYVKIY